MTDGEPVWSPAMLEAWRPPDAMTVSEWADAHRILDPLTSSEPGPYQTDRTPYCAEWMDSATLPWVRQVTILKSTQVGGTEVLNNVLGYAIDQDPGPIVFVMPRKEDAEQIGEARILPMVRASPALERHLTSRAHDWNKRRVRFDRCVLYFRSAQVPMELASIPARWLIGDECEKWPKWTGVEAPPWNLAKERQRTFHNRKAFLTSTPSRRGGLIVEEFDKGDQRRFWVPCPHCGRFQVLRFANIRWPKGSTPESLEEDRNAHYECEHCAQPIEDVHKVAMIRAGFWATERDRQEIPDELAKRGAAARREDRNPHRSYHLWAAYSPWLSWWEIAFEFLAARRSTEPGAMMNFVNSWLGEVFEEKVEDPTSELVKACVGGYTAGTVPKAVQVVVAGVDVQKDRFPYVVRGWGTDDESWLLDEGAASSVDELSEVLFSRTFGAHSVRAALIDARYRTEEVLDLARRMPHVVRMVYGVERNDPRPFSTSKMDRHPRTGQPLPFSVIVWHVNVGFFKDLLAGRIINHTGSGAHAFHIYDDPRPEYLTELGSEHKILDRTRGGREVERWVLKPGHRQNHAWDCEVYAQAAAVLIRANLLRGDGSSRRKRRKPREDDGGDGERPRRFWRST